MQNRFVRKISLTAVAGLAAFVSGCETAPPLPEVVKDAPTTIVVDILITRSPRFQRYHLVKDVLWQECGDLVEESLAPSETFVSVISETERKTVLARLGELLAANEVSEALPEVEAGEKNIIELTIHDDNRTTVLKTPEDGPNQATPNQRALRQLVSIFAKKTLVSCGERKQL